MLSLRQARLEDAPLLFEWRNDPVTRAMSRIPDRISWDSHIAWLATSIENPGRELLMVEKDGVAVATVRYDYPEPVEFSFTIAPEHRCRGLSLKIARLALSLEPRSVGYVKRENFACQRLIRAAGMRLVENGPIQTWLYIRPDQAAASGTQRRRAAAAAAILRPAI